MPVAEKMLRHAVRGRGAFLHFNKEDPATQSLKQTEWHRSIQRATLQAAIANGQDSVDISESGSLYSTHDFHYAFGRVNYRFSGARVV
ncbi:MAG TPA: hypothetical protein PK765_04705 [bacterium]|nr:hypothetical protein [bacterium]